MQDRQTKDSGFLRKLLIGVTGGIVLLIGIVAIPYPGPGWLVVFAGLAILAQEFPWAERFLKNGRKQYDKWNVWIKQQSLLIKSLTFIATTVIVILTLWLLNAYGILNNLLNLGLPWLESPLVNDNQI